MIAVTIMFIIKEPIVLSNAASDLELKAILPVENYEADFVDLDLFLCLRTGSGHIASTYDFNYATS
jgi:hypothetical protein